MSDEYPTIKKHISGLRDAEIRVKDVHVFLNRTWPTDKNPTTQIEPKQANTASTKSMIRRWADEDMTEQPYNTVGSFRPPDDEQGNTEGTGNKPDTKQEDTGYVASTKAVCGSDR